MLGLSSRTVEHLRRAAARSSLVNTEGVSSRTAPAEIEDDFCREALYRLEGDLLRYSSRQELLGLAAGWGIGAFRANFLMAQIVESVRQHGLYRPSAAERRARSAAAGGRRRGGAILLLAAVLAAVADVLVIRWLGR